MITMTHEFLIPVTALRALTWDQFLLSVRYLRFDAVLIVNKDLVLRPYAGAGVVRAAGVRP